MRKNKFKGKCAECGTMVQSGRGYLNSYQSGRKKRYFVVCSTCQHEGASNEADLGIDDEHMAAMHAVKNVPGTLYIPSSGFVGFRNPAGRCEDAPCCGCCTY